MRAGFLKEEMNLKNSGEAILQYIYKVQEDEMKHGGCVYIITNQYNKVLYTGVTAELRARIWEHKTKVYPKSFTAKYNCNKIVWFQTFQRIEEAIEKEKQIKGGSRNSKIRLIQAINPSWRDLWEDIQDL